MPQHFAQASALLQQEPSQLLPTCSCLCVAQPIRPIAAIAMAAATISLFFMFMFLSSWGVCCFSRAGVPRPTARKVVYGFTSLPQSSISAPNHGLRIGAAS